MALLESSWEVPHVAGAYAQGGGEHSSAWGAPLGASGSPC